MAPKRKQKPISKITVNTQKLVAGSSAVSLKNAIGLSYEWYFLDINNKWIKYGEKDSSQEESFSSVTSCDIENAFLADAFGSLNFYTHMFYYILKFDTMEQINLTTKKVRPVHRRPVKRLGRKPIEIQVKQPSLPDFNHDVGQTAIETLIQVKKILVENKIGHTELDLMYKVVKVLIESGTQLFETKLKCINENPIAIGTQLTATDQGSMVNIKQSIEYGTQMNAIDQKSIVIDKKPFEIGETKFQQASAIWNLLPFCNLPPLWNAMKDTEILVLVPLLSSSQEYRDVFNQFTSASLSTNGVSIQRVQNPYLWAPYKIRERELSIRYGGQDKLNIQTLFHGTKEEHVMNICKENFDWRLHGTNGRESYGEGTYFSNSAALSRDFCIPNSAGHHFMLLAEVIVGTVTKGMRGMTRPPKNPVTGESYDTTVDDVNKPLKFVKYDKQECYPLYIIEFW